VGGAERITRALEIDVDGEVHGLGRRCRGAVRGADRKGRGDSEDEEVDLRELEKWVGVRRAEVGDLNGGWREGCGST
ncbi:MAG: hypothetical protein ABEL76_06745, partial [Bradymonadaceae bacterium]